MPDIIIQTSRGQTDYRPQKLLQSCKPLVSKVCEALVKAEILFNTTSSAVRKNRYVILPADFEEAWKVRCLAVFGPSIVPAYKFVLTRLFSYHHPANRQEGRRHTRLLYVLLAVVDVPFAYTCFSADR